MFYTYYSGEFEFYTAAFKLTVPVSTNVQNTNECSFPFYCVENYVN